MPYYPARQRIDITGIKQPDTLIASVWRQYGYLDLTECGRGGDMIVRLHQPFWYRHDDAFFQQLIQQGVMTSYTHETIDGYNTDSLGIVIESKEGSTKARIVIEEER